MNACLGTLFRGCCLALVLCSFPAVAHDCTLSLSQPQVDLGMLRLGRFSLLPGQSEISLGPRRLTLTIVCPRPTAMVLRFEGDAAGPQAYRLARQGYFTVGLSNARLDGEPVTLALAGRPTERQDAWLMVPGRSLRALVHGMPAKGRFFSAQVEIDPRLSTAMTQLRDETAVEGRGRFELVPSE
ncbi:hypothetical protein [Pseudomonas asplenii]|uniref:hypothetical protein n=1 Tax=Pseudomonas asplenii TaxID=53407 RepID=UPI00036867AE|nr:hypothetical protein [Pseudomonas fuscovaginae]